MMLDFQQYQAQFTAHIRNPKQNKKPAQVANERMGVYREIVFNNILSTISACFPIYRQISGSRKWRQLVRNFMILHHADTPFFREIPQQFLSFLETQTEPEHLKQLAHYEWVELAVGTQVAEIPPSNTTPLAVTTNIILNPTAMLLNYSYAVHQMSKKHVPLKQSETFLLVFRNSDFEVKFIELNPLTYALLALIQHQNLTVSKALNLLAETIHQPLDAVAPFGHKVLEDLYLQQAVFALQRKKIST